MIAFKRISHCHADTYISHMYMWRPPKLFFVTRSEVFAKQHLCKKLVSLTATGGRPILLNIFLNIANKNHYLPFLSVAGNQISLLNWSNMALMVNCGLLQLRLRTPSTQIAHSILWILWDSELSELNFEMRRLPLCVLRKFEFLVFFNR